MSLYFKSNAPDIVKDEQSYIQYIELIINRLIMMLLFYYILLYDLRKDYHQAIYTDTLSLFNIWLIVLIQAKIIISQKSATNS